GHDDASVRSNSETQLTDLLAVPVDLDDIISGVLIGIMRLWIIGVVKAAVVVVKKSAPLKLPTLPVVQRSKWRRIFGHSLVVIRDAAVAVAVLRRCYLLAFEENASFQFTCFDRAFEPNAYERRHTADLVQAVVKADRSEGHQPVVIDEEINFVFIAGTIAFI